MQEIQQGSIAMAHTSSSIISLFKIVGLGLLASTSATALPDPASIKYAPEEQSRRVQLAHQVVSLSTVFLEAQRAGNKPADGDTVCPQVWQWKKPAFVNTCKAYRQSLASSAADDAHLGEFSGYFEAGSTPFIFLFASDFHATCFPLCCCVVQDFLLACMFTLPVHISCAEQEYKTVMFTSQPVKQQ
jgi:hypothetical protein